jgi:TonB family protein
MNGGRVELAFVLDRYGGVAFVAVQSASDDRLKEPSLEAARSWRFSPARKDGHPVSVRVVVPVVFPKRSR